MGGTTGEERRAARHAARMDDAASAAVAVALKSGSVTRDNVRAQMTDNGVCPTTVKDTYAGGTNPNAVRHATSEIWTLCQRWRGPSWNPPGKRPGVTSTPPRSCWKFSVHRHQSPGRGYFMGVDAGACFSATTLFNSVTAAGNDEN